MQKKKLVVICDKDVFLKNLLIEWETQYNVKYFTFTNKKKAILNLPRFYRSIKTADFIFIEWMAASALWFLNSFLGKAHIKNPPPIIIRCHAFEIFSPYVKKMNVTKVSKVICVSHAYESILLEVKPELKGKTTTIYNGIDIQQFYFPNQKPKNNETVMIGQYDWNKRFIDVVAIWKTFDSFLHLVGEAKNSTEEQTKFWIEKYITLYQIKVKLHGYIQHDQLPQFLQDKSFLVNNSWHESFAVAMVEAMASGLIVFSFERPDTKEILPEELIFSDSCQLKEKLQLFFEMDNQEILEWRKKLRNIVETKFSLEIQKNEFSKLFASLSK